jgi:hypothetical protein
MSATRLDQAPDPDQIEQALLRHVDKTVNGLTLRKKRDPATGENVYWIEPSPERQMAQD